MAWLRMKWLEEDAPWAETEPAAVRGPRELALVAILLSGIVMVVLIALDAGRSQEASIAVFVGAHVGWLASRVGLAGKTRRQAGRDISASLFRAGLGCVAVAAALFFLYPAAVRFSGAREIRLLVSAMALGQGALVFWVRFLVSSRERSEVSGVAASTCPECGYSLVGMPTLDGTKAATRLRRCPECGWIDIPTKRRDTRNDDDRLAAAKDKVQAVWEPTSDKPERLRD